MRTVVWGLRRPLYQQSRQSLPLNLALLVCAAGLRRPLYQQSRQSLPLNLALLVCAAGLRRPLKERRMSNK
jgi:hypothetical protein